MKRRKRKKRRRNRRRRSRSEKNTGRLSQEGRQVQRGRGRKGTVAKGRETEGSLEKFIVNPYF